MKRNKKTHNIPNAEVQITSESGQRASDAKLFRLLTVLVICTAAMLRFQYLFGALEYDEIWSLENFSILPLSRIFTELALPNNQPLNSVWIKFSVWLSLPIWGIRLLSFAAGVLTVPLIGFISFILSGGKKYAVLWSMFFLSFSAPDITYAVLARGYALQVFFLALYTCGLASSRRWRPKKRMLRFLPETAVALGGTGAILTLPTSIMYLTAITLCAWLIYGQKPGKMLTAVLTAGALFTLWYCITNYPQLNAARVWGTPINSTPEYIHFLGRTMKVLLPVSGILAALFALVNSPVRMLPALLIFFVPLTAAAVTNAGPPRTYLPFCAVIAVLAGCGASSAGNFIRKRYIIPAAGLLAALVIGESNLNLKKWKIPDWGEVYQSSAKEPYSVLVVHRATSSYPIGWNNRPEIYTDFVKRLLDRSTERELLMFDGPGRINGNDDKNNEAVFSLMMRGKPDKKAGLSCRRYRIVETENIPDTGEVILVAIRPVPDILCGTLLAELIKSNISWLKLNPWLNYQINRPEGVYRYALLAGKVPQDCNLNWQKFLNSNGMISVYRFVKAYRPEAAK